MKEVKGAKYRVTYDPSTATLAFEGTLRLRDVQAYGSLITLFDRAVAAEHEVVTLDVRGLDFLNSSGINVLFQFVIKLRDRAVSQLVVRGTSRVLWQTRTLQNMRRLMPDLQLDLK
jgi:hypothetical protein